MQTAGRNWCKVAGTEFIGILSQLRNVVLDHYTWNSVLFLSSETIPEAFPQSFLGDSLSSPKIACIYDMASKEYRLQGIPDNSTASFSSRRSYQKFPIQIRPN